MGRQTLRAGFFQSSRESLLQGIGQVYTFPREISGRLINHAAKMPITRGLLIDGATQIKGFDNTAGTQINGIGDKLCKGLFTNNTGAMGIHKQRQRLHKLPARDRRVG